MKKIYLLLAVLIFLTSGVFAQVTLTATAGTATGSFTTLKGAFDAINAGTHQGVIVISINASTVEGATPATLNSSDAAPASYTSVLIQPTADLLSISGNPVTGFGVIQLKGADNVTIDGDNPNSAGTHRDLTVNNTALTTVIANSAIRIATAATVLSANNITIKNCNLNGNVTGGNSSLITSTAGSSNSSFGIYCGGNGGSSATDAPTAITSVTANSAPAGTTINNLLIDNNTVNQCARGIVFIGANATVSTGVTITNNLVGDQSTVLSGTPPYITPVTTVYTKGIYIAGTTAINISANTVKNIISYVATQTSGIELNAAIGAGGASINNNNIVGVVCNTTSAAFGIIVSNSSSAPTVSGNTVSNIQMVGVGAVNIAGIQMTYTGASALVEKNRISTVYNRTTNGWGSYGINVTAGAACTIQNNFIWDINAFLNNTALTNQFGIFGIRLAAGSTHKVYHNSIHISGAALGSSSYTSVAALVIAATSQTGLDVRNNIFSCTLTGAPASSAVTAIFLPSGGTSAMNLTMNNNAYYEGTGTGAAIAQVGTTVGTGVYLAANFNAGAITPSTNLRSATSTLSVAGTNDNASLAFSIAAPFTSSTNLHIPAATPGPLESGGASVGVAADIDGDTRPGPTGSVNGGGTLPDIGADEFDGVLATDIASPSISYTPLSSTCVLGNQVLTATITDATGVPIAGTGLPMLYYKINAGAYTGVQGVSIGSNQYTFTFGGLATSGDVLSYYIVAQDLVGTPNVGAFPSAGAAGFTANPPAASTPPTSPSSFAYGGNLGGTYTVGSGGNYPTLTAAVLAFNSACSLTSPVIFSLTDATYPSETFPITINQNAFVTAAKTLTIKPATGTSPLITGSLASAPLIKVLCNYVTVDGSNNGTASRDMTISNTSTTAPIVILLGSLGTTPILNSTLKNTNLINGVNSSSAAVLSDATTPGSAGYFNNITIQNNSIQKAYIGLYTNAFLLAGNGSGTLIKGNLLNTAGANAIRFTGLYVQGADGVTLSNNQIGNFENATSEDDKGIWLATGTVNTTVDKNKISNLNYSGTGGYGGHGIYVSTGLAAANIKLTNNFIANLSGDGWDYTGLNALDNPIGIVLTTTQGGIAIQDNSINFSGNTLNQTLALSMGIYLGAGSTADIRDNIIVNNLGLSAALGYGAAGIYAVTSNAQFTAINYNDYYVSPTGSGNKYIGQIAAAGQATFAGWQGVSGGDGSSQNLLPVFVSAIDLHLDPLNGSNLPLDNTGTTIAGITTDIDGNTRSATPDLGADEFTFGTVVAVAIEFFRGSKLAGANYLDWKVDCTSAPSVKLVLERSADGRTFGTIQSQDATATRCLQGFNYTDVSPLKGINYYRLKMITPDGAFRYSVIVALINGDKGLDLISVAPNPVRGETVLTVTSAKGGKLDVSVTDPAGRVVMQRSLTVIAGNNPINFDFSSLGAGTYRITAINADAERKTIQFVKY